MNVVSYNDNMNLSNKSFCDVNDNASNTPLASQILAANIQPNTALAKLTAPIVNLGVNNISSYQPSVDELRVLALGLNFIPEPNDITNIEIYQALDEYADTIM